MFCTSSHSGTTAKSAAWTRDERLIAAAVATTAMLAIFMAACFIFLLPLRRFPSIAFWLQNRRIPDMRLNIAAGTAVRFEPGEDKSVSLVMLAGTRTMIGCNGLVQGALDDESIKAAALQKVVDEGFGII